MSARSAASAPRRRRTSTARAPNRAARPRSSRRTRSPSKPIRCASTWNFRSSNVGRLPMLTAAAYVLSVDRAPPRVDAVGRDELIVALQVRRRHAELSAAAEPAHDVAVQRIRPAEADRRVAHAAVRDQPADQRAADRHDRQIEQHRVDRRRRCRSLMSLRRRPLAQPVDVPAAAFAEVERVPLDQVRRPSFVAKDRPEVLRREVQHLRRRREDDVIVHARRFEQRLLRIAAASVAAARAPAAAPSAGAART